MGLDFTTWTVLSMSNRQWTVILTLGLGALLAGCEATTCARDAGVAWAKETAGTPDALGERDGLADGRGSNRRDVVNSGVGDAALGEDANPDSALAQDAADSEAEDATGLDVPSDASGGGCSTCLKPGTVHRVTLLQVTQLDGKDHPVIGVLNPLWAEDIALYELNILFRVVSVEDTELQLSVLSGARVGTDGQICAMEDTVSPLSLTRAGCLTSDPAPTVLSIFDGAPTTPKTCTTFPTTLPVRHVIPVVNAKITADYSSDCTVMINGQVDGVIALEAIEQICTCSTGTGIYSDKCGSPDDAYVDANCGGCGSSWKSLLDLLKAFGPLDFSCTTEDDKPGVCIKARFEAVAFDAPPSCP